MQIQKIKCSACNEIHQIEISIPEGSSRLLQFVCPKTHQTIIFHASYFESVGILPEPFNPSKRQLKDYQMPHKEPTRPK